MKIKTATCTFAIVVLIGHTIIMWTVKYYLSTKSVVCPCKWIHFKISFYTFVIELVLYCLIETLLYVSNAWKELVLSGSIKASNQIWLCICSLCFNGIYLCCCMLFQVLLIFCLAWQTVSSIWWYAII